MYEGLKRITHIAIVNGKDCSLDNSSEKQNFVAAIFSPLPLVDIICWIFR